MNCDYWGNGGLINTSPATAADTNPHIWVGGATSAVSHNYRYDSGGEYNFNNYTGNAGPAGGLYLGGEGTDTEHSDGDIGEVLVYNRELTSAERGQVEAYLYDKWLPPITLYGAVNNVATASGGTVNNSGGYVTITFTGSGSITLPGTVNGVSELIVGAGGSGAAVGVGAITMAAAAAGVS